MYQLLRYAVSKVIPKCLGGLLVAMIMLAAATELTAQDYEFTLNQRRMGNQIGVEIWVKSANSSVANLGDMSISVLYNNLFLLPATLSGTNPSSTTDSIHYDMDLANPYITITSPYANALYGFDNLAGQAADGNNGSGHIYVFQLDVKTVPGSPAGFQPATTDRGTFIGMLKFNIINHANIFENTLTGIAFNQNSWLAALAITDINGNNQTANSTFTNQGNFTVRGVTLLNPNYPNQAVNRYPDAGYPILGGNLGYPIYFERSGLDNPAPTNYGNNKFAYQLSYSLDNGSNYTEFGRVAEHNALVVANDNYYASGEIDAIGQMYITQPDGTILTSGYGGILRTVWGANENFQYRSEQAMMRIRQIAMTGTGADITLRSALSLDSLTRWDVSNNAFVLGRLFFVQLDGTSGYFKTARTFSNATRVTVEAWVNLNSIQAGGSPAVVASSAGSVSPEEGAWMLYLHDGMYPAFRAREIEGRGTDGYIGTVISADPLAVTSDAFPLATAHASNWVHLAGVVEDNKVRLYVNGEEVGRYTNTNAVNIRMLTTNHPIWVGVNPNLGIEANDYLHAGIKEVKVWRNALSQEQIRTHASGVYMPTDTTVGDERTTLELYYPLQGSRSDRANAFYFQNSITEFNFYNSASPMASMVNELINYRPDRSHIRLTSPIGGEGVSNLMDRTFDVRWVAYGLGSIAPGSEDLLVQVSRDGGLTWFDAIDNDSPAMPLDIVEVEAGKATWEPYNNATFTGQDDDLQGVIDLAGNYSKRVKLRISGTEDRNQNDIYDESGLFTVAPNFAFTNLGTAKVRVPNNTTLNLTNSNYMLEAWIRPFRFPTAQEGSFPIVSKKSDDGNNLDYALRLLPTGQLQLELSSTTGNASRIATSSAHPDSLITIPNVVEYDTAWTHVAVYVQLGGTSSVIFYIDGTPQWTGDLTDQLGNDITVNVLSSNPAFLGYEPTGVTSGNTFIGDIKEIRFWNGYPGGQNDAGNAPNSNLTKFIQGALTVRADELGTFAGNDYAQNLVAAYILNGGSFVNNGIMRTVAAYPSNADINANISGSGYYYTATKPYLKVVTPTYKQRVQNSSENLKVRWVGFDYNRNNLVTFRTGAGGANEADLEYSIEGGGGVIIQHYQFVASEAYNPIYTNAMSIPVNQNMYEFPGTTNKSQYASVLNVSVADPDLNNDETFDDQGPIAAANTNARLRLTGRSTINGYMVEYINGAAGTDGYMPTLRPESALFTITPQSNFTIRTLLEGYHDGITNGILSNLGTTAWDVNDNGLQIDLFQNNSNSPGVHVASAFSENAYLNNTTAFSTANRNAGNNTFANVPFVFDELLDGRYFVKVSHINHLSVMSRFAAPFAFSGDDNTTWDVESGWDFQNWDGTSGNELSSADAATNPPTIGTAYTARGNSETDINISAYATTALIFNEGQGGGSAALNSLAAMVGGDVYRDGRINALDRAKVVADNGLAVVASDVTGNGAVNAADRQIVYRNNGKEEDPSMPVPADLPGSVKTDEMDIHTAIIAGNTMNFSDLAQMFVDSEKNPSTSKQMNSNFVSKDENIFLSGAISYDITALPKLNNQYVDIAIYAKNTGGDFGLGNSTLGVKFENSKLKFLELINTENVIYNDRQDLGYFPTFSSPSLTAKNPIADVRCLDINFDNYKPANKPGLGLPKSDTYLGTLRFQRLSMNDSYFFDWHNITVVFTVDGREVTAEGNFKPILPILIDKPVTLLYPNGGENLAAGRPYVITWTEPTFTVPVHVDFSANNGTTWSRVTASPISLAKTSYNWLTPKINSDKCLISLVNAETGSVIDRSDAVFTLATAPAIITRPASTDAVYKGGTNDFIRWEIEDNVKVKFEFSENGTSNWVAVTPVVNSKNQQAPWILPMVNTKRAVVRMVDAESGEVLATSQQFRILTGSVTITSPRGGEKLQAGVMKPVRWVYDNVNQFDLQLSLDGGNTWSFIGNDVKAIAKMLEWIAPNVNTKIAHIRAIYNGDGDLEYSRTPAFEIMGATDVDNASNYGLSISTITPNPFNSQSYVTFTIANDMNVSVELYNAAGMKVMTVINNEYLIKGTNVAVIDGEGLTSGMYFVRINANGLSVVREMVYIK
ncbi:MAG: T9SS type A sorting domain-containing protein [Candidatus Kapabacteria bacterium]|nr:T9SS type A sorting domain-containing protein [Candidatus Kapabacteria bacterium]